MVASAAGNLLTLRDLTTGSRGNVLEDISYGTGPMRGRELCDWRDRDDGLKPETMELRQTLFRSVAGWQKAWRWGEISPTAAEMRQQKRIR